MKSFHLCTSDQLSCVPILESIRFLVISWDQVLDARMHVFLSISSKSSVHSHPVNREAEAWPGVLSILGVSCIMSQRLWQNVRNLWKRKAKWILACRREVGRKPYLPLREAVSVFCKSADPGILTILLCVEGAAGSHSHITRGVPYTQEFMGSTNWT